MRRHTVDLSDLVAYSRCPMEYAYQSIIKTSSYTKNAMVIWQQIAARAMKSMAREFLKYGFLSVEKTQLLWAVYTRDTVISKRPRLNAIGRDLLHKFYEWMHSSIPLALAVPRAIPVNIGKEEVLEVRVTADLCVNIDGVQHLVKIVENKSDIESHILSLDTIPWKVFDISRGVVKEPASHHYVSTTLKQVIRGLFRKIIWANQDARCSSCVFQGKCNPIHANIKILNNKQEVKKLHAKLVNSNV